MKSVNNQGKIIEAGETWGCSYPEPSSPPLARCSPSIDMWEDVSLHYNQELCFDSCTGKTQRLNICVQEHLAANIHPQSQISFKLASVLVSAHCCGNQVYLKWEKKHPGLSVLLRKKSLRRTRNES